MYLDFDNAIQQWTIYTETKEKIEILKVTGIKLNEEFNKKYTQNKGHLPTIALNLLIKYYLKPGIYKIERDIYLGMINDTTFKVYTSNQLTLIINDNKHTKPIKLLKNEPIKSGDNIYLGFQKETTDSLYTFNWLINEKKDSTLTYKNLYQINKDYTGKLNIKLQTTTNLSGCTAYDSVELNITPRKIDTTYITKTDTIYITKTDTIYITKTDTIYITKTDTIYIDKTSEKTAINTKQVNLNVWPNPTTTFVNAEAEELELALIGDVYGLGTDSAVYNASVMQYTYRREEGRENLGDLLPAELARIFLEVVEHLHAVDVLKHSVCGVVFGEHIEYRVYV